VSASEPAHEEAAVRGERSAALVNAARSMQARVSNILAAALMIALGVGALTWYYAHALTRQSHARAAAQSTVQNRAQGEMPLPPLGRIVPPPAAVPEAVPSPAEAPLLEAPAPVSLPTAPNAAASLAPALSPAAVARERRGGGAVFTRAADSAATPGAPAATDGGAAAAAASGTRESARAASEAGEGALSSLLRPSASAVLQAQRLPTSRLLLPQGAFIDCTLETAIDSTLPGMTTCITAADTFGADGKVVLLERGTKLVGETRGQVQQGQARVFVAWAQARTPTGVIVPLDSPGTDELGRAGLPGEVEHHFWQRFGAAMLISVVDGAVQAGVQASSRSGGTVVYAPSASQDVLTEVLKDTLRIAPTVVKRNGDRIQVLVAHDVDFRSVYELRIAGR
jgi:type IV secretion system protein VirB10